MLKKLLDTALSAAKSKSSEERRAELYRNLIRHEAKIGGEIFGKTDNVRREFFCLDEHTIVWHEETRLPSGDLDVRTTTYDIRPTGVVKMSNGSHYQAVGIEETKRLLDAMRLYKKRVHTELYPFVQA